MPPADQQQLGRIEASLNFIKEDSRRRLADGEAERKKLHERINAVIAEQTKVNGAIYGRISSIKFWTTGSAFIGGVVGTTINVIKSMFTGGN